MSREFYFGEFYDNIDEATRESLIRSATPYERNKNTFVTDIYDNEGSINTSYNALKKNVIPMEKLKDKDLMNFSIEELINLMKSMPTPSSNTKDRVYHLIDAYLDWCINRGYIGLNGLKGLSKDELCKVSKSMINYKLISREELLELCELCLETNKVTVMELIPIVIARYGIVGENLSRMKNLRWEDVDRENKVVRVYEGGHELLFPIDDDFINWIDRAKDLEVTSDGISYIDKGYVLKIREDYPNENIDDDNNYIYNKVLGVFNLGILQRISFKSLETCRKFDILLNTRSERVLDSSDFRAVTKMFKPNASPASANTLIRDYETLTGDLVKLKKKSKVVPVDLNPKATTEAIMEQIGYVK